MSNYLVDLATERRELINTGIFNIKNELAKTTGDLKSYVDFCAVVETSKNQKENLDTSKKELEDMKTQL